MKDSLPYRAGLLLLFLLVSRPAPLAAQPPVSLHGYWMPLERKPPTAWEYWMLHTPAPKDYLARRRIEELGMTQPLLTPSTPEDNPFASQMTLLDEGGVRFGVSGARGFNLRYLPRTWFQWRQLLRLRNLLHLRQWVQPESNELRMQNLLGASFYFTL